MYLRQSQIAYRKSTHQIGFYDYYRRLQTRVSPSRQRSSIRFAPGPRLQLSGPMMARSDPITSSQDGLRSSTKIDCGTGVMVEAKLSAALTNLQWEPSRGLAMQRKLRMSKGAGKFGGRRNESRRSWKQQSAREQYGITNRRSGELRDLESVRSGNGSNQKGCLCTSCNFCIFRFNRSVAT
jgi:hypothetical protein